tara:strand:- start:141 stop:311 length:171 start_codon:yes stop_codon:yes gene_type:complete
MRAAHIYEATKEKMPNRMPKNANAAAQIMKIDAEKRFYQTEMVDGGYHLYGLREWI